jgi:hypothetical protein
MTDAIAGLGLDAETVPYRVMLVHPATLAPLQDQNGDQAYVEIDGYNSPAGEKLMRQVKLRMATKGKRVDDADVDKARAENAEALAGLTRSWRLVNKDTGQLITDEQLACNFANARMIYADKRTAWITSQVGAALQDQSNFIKA